MNKLEIKNIEDYLDKKNIVGDVLFKDIDWKIQNAKEDTLIFINAEDGKKFVEKFNNYLQKNEAIIITNNELIYDNYIANKLLATGENFFKLRKYICDLVYGDVEKYKFKKIGVTGTNGKTSTVKIFEQICAKYSKNCFSIGTLGLFSNLNFIKDFNLTSPDYIDIRKSFYQFRDFDYGIFEISSHALVQQRFYKIYIDLALWTNITQDHLDFHKTMENYFEAKFLITKLLQTNSLLLSEDMKSFEGKFEKINYKIIEKYKGILNKNVDADFFRKNLSLSLEAFKILNNFSPDNLNFLKPIEGRFNRWIIESNEIIVDFAHTPDALENLCKSIEKNNKKFVLIFGCGGNRDKTKRPIMGSIAEKYADESILTVDNPRDEDPMQICKDIASGFKKEIYHINLDRKEAIRKSIKTNRNAIIVIAGKGHENYIEIKGIKHPYSDVEIVEEFLND